MKFLLHGEKTDRLHFRSITKSDFDDWLEFFKHPDSFKHWTVELETPDLECEKWYTKQFDRYENDLGGMNALIEKQSGQLVGHCGLLVQTVDDQQELEIGYSLLPAFWGKGYASEAARKCRDFAFNNNLSDSLISIISLTNKASENVARKNGMWVDKVTEYKGNRVSIFRINQKQAPTGH